MNKAKTVLLSRVLLPPISGGRPAGGINAKTEGVPSLGGENIKPNGGMKYDDIRIIPEAFYDQMPKGKLQPLDVLINKDGAQTGKVGLYDGAFDKAAVNEHLFILRTQDPANLEQVYLFYCLLLPEIQQKIYRRITGSAQPGINSQFVQAVDIPIYKLPRQQKIARILQTIDRAIEKTEALIEKYQQIKAGLMHDLFTRGIGPYGQLRPPREQAPELYQETPIGWIPKEWEIAGVTRLGNVVTGSTPPASAPGVWGDYLPFVTPAEIREDGTVVSTERGVSEFGLKYIRTLPKAAVLIVCIGSTVGKVGLAPWPCATNQQINALVCHPDVDPIFAYAAITNSIFQVHRWVGLQAVPIVKKSQFEKMLVPVAPIEEQMQVAWKTQQIEAAIGKEKSSRKKLISLKKGLMHDLLTGKVPVQVEEPEIDPEATHV